MSTRASIDPDRCIGSTECNRIAPEAFRLDPERGVSFVLEGVQGVPVDSLEAAVRDCPTQAITLLPTDEASG
jgi:ferredoxin